MFLHASDNSQSFQKYMYAFLKCLYVCISKIFDVYPSNIDHQHGLCLVFYVNHNFVYTLFTLYFNSINTLCILYFYVYYRCCTNLFCKQILPVIDPSKNDTVQKSIIYRRYENVSYVCIVILYLIFQLYKFYLLLYYCNIICIYICIYMYAS